MTRHPLSHLSSSDQAALFEFSHRLRHQFGNRIVHVWFFGSKARGDADAESDIDLLVVALQADWALEKSIARLAFQVDMAYGTVLSPHVVGRQRFAQMKARREPLFASIVAEGTDLWTLEPTTTT